jgi:superfamily II DNA helicase RecQ
MDRRNLNFAVSLHGEVFGPMFKEVESVLKANQTNKVLLYTNTKQSAEDVLLKRSETLLSSLEGCGDAIPLTGSTGLMMKNWLINLFSGETESDVANLRIVLATSAANCGVSSNFCRYTPRLSTPPNMYDLMQEMGRLNRDGKERVPSDKYHIFLSIPLYVNIYLRIMREKKEEERAIQLKSLMEVLRFLLLPTECYHLTLELFFGDPAVPVPTLPCGRRFTCGTQCSYCRRDHLDFTTPFYRSRLVHFLSTSVFLEGPASVATLIKMLGDNKKSYFPAGYSTLPRGKIHALVLQLIAAGILSLKINTTASNKIGNDRLTASDVEVNWATTYTRTETILAHEQSHRWSVLNSLNVP